MNKYQIAKLVTYKIMVRVTREYPQIMSLSPRFNRGIDRLEAICLEIDALGTRHTSNITGVTGAKNSLLKKLAGYLIEVAAAVYSYAISKNDYILQARVKNYKKSAVNRLSQTKVLIAASIVVGEASKIAPEELAMEGISAEGMTEFREAYTHFSEASPKPRQAIIIRSGYAKELIILFAEASRLKRNTLDPLVIQFKRKSPQFYQQYKDGSNLIYRRKSKPKVVIEVLKESDLPFNHLQFTI